MHAWVSIGVAQEFQMAPALLLRGCTAGGSISHQVRSGNAEQL